MSGSATARAERIADFLLRHPDADRRDVEDAIKRRAAGSPLPEIPVDFVNVIVGGKGEFDRFFNGKADLAHVRAWEAKVEAEPVKRRMPLEVWIKAGKDLSPEAQARRGRVSGLRRRRAKLHRDRQIHALHLQGKSLREIARKVGLSSHTSVGKVLQRDRAVVAAHGRVALLRRTPRRFIITRRRGCSPNHLLRRTTGTNGRGGVSQSLPLAGSAADQTLQAALYSLDHDRRWRGPARTVTDATLPGVLSGRWRTTGGGS